MRSTIGQTGLYKFAIISIGNQITQLYNNNNNHTITTILLTNLELSKQENNFYDIDQYKHSFTQFYQYLITKKYYLLKITLLFNNLHFFSYNFTAASITIFGVNLISHRYGSDTSRQIFLWKNVLYVLISAEVKSPKFHTVFMY